MSWPIASLRRYGVNNVSLTIVTGRYIVEVQEVAVTAVILAGSVLLVKAGSNSILRTAAESTVIFMP